MSGGLAATEWRLQRRHGVISAMAIVTVCWAAGLIALPPSWRTQAAPWVLFLDLAGIGLFFVPALTTVERAGGITASHRLSPVPATRFLAVRIGGMVCIAVAAGAVVVGVARPDSPVPVMLGVALLATFFALLAVVMMGRSETLTGYLGRIPFVAIPLLTPAILDASSLVRSGLLRLSPVTSAMRLLAGRGDAFDLAWLSVSIVGLWIAAARMWLELGADTTTGATRRRASTRSPRPSTSAWRSFATVDRRTVLGDRILILIMSGIPLLALAVRWLGTSGLGWVSARWGVDLTDHLPLIWAFVLVVHIPMMIGAVAGMVFLEDRDAGLLPAVAATPSSLVGLVRYRMTVTSTATAAAVLVAMPLAGARHQAGWVGVAAAAVASGAVSTVVAMSMATLGRDRVQGMALIKALGVPFYLPLATWVLTGPVAWLLMALPSAWPARAFWAATALEAVLWSAGGTAASAVITVTLARRLSRSVI